jgi:Peptidase S46
MRPLIRFLFACVLVAPPLAFAAEGMWTLDNLPRAKMQAEYGFAPSDAWVQHVMRSAVRLAGGCSGSFVSSSGLVMTNHHCVRSCLRDLSTARRDLARDGFHAATRAAERRCPAMELNRLEQISDVTATVVAATRGLDGEDFKRAQNAVRARLTAACEGQDGATIRCDLVSLYRGGIYQIYRYHRFSDTRLVWAPEDAIADFGGDPDNFDFPRYALDAAFLRVYENGKPAAVADWFPFSAKGAAAGELTLVVGHPGGTDRQLTVAQLRTLRDVKKPDTFVRIAELRGVLEQYSEQGPEFRRVADPTLLGIDNFYKLLKGETLALRDPELMRRKGAEEEALKAFVSADASLRTSTAGAWAAIEKAQADYRDIAGEYELIEGTRSYSSDYFSIARRLVRAAAERPKPDADRLPEFADARRTEVEQELFSPAPISPDFEKTKLAWALTKMRERLGADHPAVKQALGKESPRQVAERLVAGTTLANIDVRRALWDGGQEAIQRSSDPFIRFALALDPAARAARKRYENQVDSIEMKNGELIAQARFAQSGPDAYPDATFTLRLSYGEVKGWVEGGVAVAPFTRVAGIYERQTGAEPFALPASWFAARERIDPALPMNFVSSNDIIGGNSGSPMLNRDGEIVGLVFDGNLLSLGGSFAFDERVNRTVAVHSSLILEALRKIYGAGALADEIAGR